MKTLILSGIIDFFEKRQGRADKMPEIFLMF